MYKVGDYIVYSNNGVCKVEDISELNVPGTNKTNNYYTLRPIHGNGTVFIPVDTSMFMRTLVTSDEIKQLIENIPFIDETINDSKNAKLLQQHYKKLLSTYECTDTFSALIGLNSKKIDLMKNGKKLGQVEDKYFKIAKDLIEYEFSVVLGISKKEAQEYIDLQILNKNVIKIII